MSRLKIFSPIFLFFHAIGFGLTPIYECGLSTGIAFNGWSVSPYAAITNVSFNEETVSFFVEDGGDFTVCLTRKIEHLKNFQSVDFTIAFEVIENAILNKVDFFVSPDGKNWTTIQLNQNSLKATLDNNVGNQFICIKADVSFKRNGYIECTYVKVEESELIELVKNPNAETLSNTEFFIFFFNGIINVETQIEKPYQLVITNLSGQVVYTITLNGSDKVEPNLSNGTYVVSILMNNAVIKSKKLICAN